MPQRIPAPAVRVAAVATATTALALAAVLPATPAAAATPSPAALSAPVVRIVPGPSAALAPLTRAPAASATGTATSLAAGLTDTAARLAPSARGTSAMAQAVSKIGSPYRWGASGPSSFDCSGLVSWSYKQVGVSLPRSSRAMSTVGQPVAKADLRPGDLVFFYKPVSHVAIYIGNGKVVHASTSSQPVKVSDLSQMPFTAARRV